MTYWFTDTAMLARIDAAKAELKGLRVGVYGLGISGRAMAEYLMRRGAVVVLVDAKTPELPVVLSEGPTVVHRFGPVALEAFDDVAMLAISPGVDPRKPEVTRVRDRGVPIVGELELCAPLPGLVAAVTGTNGKSTTTALLGVLASARGARTFTGGNLGSPIANWVDQRPTELASLELSSYQLETAYRFKPRAAVVLNLTPDHAERYASIADYAAAKAHIVENQGPEDSAILNADDAIVAAMAKGTKARVLWFSTRGATLPGPDGAWLEGDRVRAVGAAAVLDGLDLTHPRLFGRHNRENALAAFLAVVGLGIVDAASRAHFERAYQEFKGLEHRLELVAEVRGVRYVNDTKATNDDAAAIAVAAMDRPVVLLAGGVDKGGGYSRLVEASREHVRIVYAYGAAQKPIAEAFAAHPGLRLSATMKTAFAEAAKEARSGEVVLLAPACSSFDEFTNYAHRGRTFKELVHGLPRGAS